MKIADSQKIRVISGHACFYTTAKQIRAGVGDLVAFNSACAAALTDLESGSLNRFGISGIWNSIAVQLDMQ